MFYVLLMFMDDLRYFPCPDMSGTPEPPAPTAEMEWRMGQQESMRGHLTRLDRLAEIAMAMAETVGERAVKDPCEADVATFEKISQIVRKVIALRAHLGQGFLAEGKRLIAEREEARQQALLTHDVRKQTIIVDMVAQAGAETFPDRPQDAAAMIRRDARRLLEDLDDYGNYLDLPVGETVARLCQDLGLDPDWCLDGDDHWITKSPLGGVELSQYANPPSIFDDIQERVEWLRANPPDP